MTKPLAQHTHKIPGLAFIALLTLLSYLISTLPLITNIGISAMVVAILLGILVGNLWHHPSHLSPGIQFAAKTLLRTAIVLYGFRITFQQIAIVGLEALVIDIIIVSTTLTVGYLIGRNLLKLDKDLALLISAGAAICGAAAVLAVEDILKSEPYKAAVAIGTVVLFGTFSMFLLPALQQYGILGFNQNQFGIFAGASIHEVAQVVVAGTQISNSTSEIAVIVKMTRVILLVPVLVILSGLHHYSSGSKKDKKQHFTLPWFAVGFILIIILNSLHHFTLNTLQSIKQVDLILLTMAMAAIGIETKWHKIKAVGIKPLYLASILFLWLMTIGFLLVKLAA